MYKRQGPELHGLGITWEAGRVPGVEFPPEEKVQAAPGSWHRLILSGLIPNCLHLLVMHPAAKLIPPSVGHCWFSGMSTQSEPAVT